jgi:Secretion system C-terminal sorting domain
MSMNYKFYLLLFSFALISKAGFSQPTVELSTSNFPPAALNGPSTAQVGVIPFMKDINNDNKFQTIGSGSAEYTTATFRFENQVWSGLSYSNISTGLVFGASPTTAVDNVTPGTPTQRVDVLPIYNNLGYYDIFPGGPTDNMFTVDPSFPAGTGIVANPVFPNPGNQIKVNGAVSIFTAAQVLYNNSLVIPGLAGSGTNTPLPHNAGTRYYYGDLVISLNRYVANPTLHIAGLGGSYRYLPVGLPDINANWVSTFFKVELEIDGFNGTKLSNPTPNGASVSTIPAGTRFDEIGGASGSVRIAANINQIRLKVYLVGSNNSTNPFPWSAPQSAVNGSNRNPFTGDIIWVSVSAASSQLITLPSTGVQLAGALNGSNVQLNWKTQTEINSKHFEVERSTDGVNFSGIGIKDAAGNSVSDRNYDYLDVNVQSDVTYYRLKMVDIDDRYAYSNIVVIRKSKGDIKGVRIYPNPSNGIFNLEFSNAKGTYMMGLYNQAGQEVMRKQLVVDATVQNLPVGSGNLPVGTYLLSIRNSTNTEVYSQQVIITK